MFSLLCDERGVIRQVLRGGDALPSLAPGVLISNAVDPGSRVGMLNFLVELRYEGLVLDAPIVLPAGEQPAMVSLSGALIRDAMLVVGARSLAEALPLCDEQAALNVQPAIALRAAIKAVTQSGRAQSNVDSGLYDDIIRLNNELVGLQRDLAKKNAELERLHNEVQKLAITDSLTGFYNRRGFYELGEREVKRSVRYGRPLVAAVIDVDHFKTINDTHGHAIGDRVLWELSGRFLSALRESSILCRHGGEEFAILFTEAGMPKAVIAAERLLIAARKPVEVAAVRLDTTVSIGLAEIGPAIANLSELLDKADQALYQAKRNGRDQLFVYEGLH